MSNRARDGEKTALLRGTKIERRAKGNTNHHHRTQCVSPTSTNSSSSFSSSSSLGETKTEKTERATPETERDASSRREKLVTDLASSAHDDKVFLCSEHKDKDVFLCGGGVVSNNINNNNNNNNTKRRLFFD